MVLVHSGSRPKTMLYKRLNFDLCQSELICFVGAGGKTTSMFKLAQELKGLGKRVLVTTTTAIFYPDKNDCDEIIVTDSRDFTMLNQAKKGILVLGREISPNNKLLGFDREVIENIYKQGLFDYILVEADGAKRRPIKAPADHEPVIPVSTSKTIALIGLDCIQKRINSEYVHRPEIFARLTDSSLEDKINEEKIFRLITSKQGLFKNVPEKCERYLLLNKLETKEREKAAYKIIDMLTKSKFKIDAYLACNLLTNKYLEVLPRAFISGIIMASGFSKRMKQEKLILDINGIPLVERVIKAAVESGLDEIILIYKSNKVKILAEKYAVKTEYNSRSNLGQSEAIKLGVKSSNSKAAGFMFLTGDQAFITAEIINKVIDVFKTVNYPVVLPIYNGKRGNPVIFSSQLKDELLKLDGDNGARVIMKKIPRDVKKVYIDEAFRRIDIDTPEDYYGVCRLDMNFYDK